MEIIRKETGEVGYFIPMSEFKSGRFFSEKELIQLQEKILAQRESIIELQQELIQ